MRNWLVIAGVALFCSAGVAEGQADSALFTKAQQMVSNGDAEAGRALIDSLIGVVPAGSARYAEALYWKATLAGSAADAERSYRQIVVDYPVSPRVDDALLRMGQLELARGDRESALQHFQRLASEHPDSPLRAKGSYYLARAFFEKNDIKRGCGANADALAHARPSDVELKNQIDFQNQRCSGVVVESPAAVQTASAAGETSVDETAVDTPATATEKAATKKGVKAAKPVAKGKASKPVPVAETADVTEATDEPVAEPVAETPVAPVKATAAGKKSAAVKAAKSGKFAVQVAAYYDKPQAEALAAKLRTRGYPVHVDGAVAPFRVRIGHYATHEQAATALENMKAKKITGFVTQE